MANVAHKAAGKVVDILSAPAGLTAAISALGQLEDVALAEIPTKQVVAQNVGFEVAERSLDVKYPAVHVYCEKLANLLTEKFRVFSGKASMAIEVRISRDRLQGLERELQLYAGAVTRVLDQNRGDWGNGMFYTGGYAAAFGPVKHGGKNLIQIAKISFEVDISSN